MGGRTPASDAKSKEDWARANPDKLSPSEYVTALNQAREELFVGASPSSHPVAIILAGQPGSGKSRLADASERELTAKGGAVTIDVDALREFHPRYEKLAGDDPETSATRVQPDASKMSKDLRSEATAQLYNLIIDGTLNDPDKAEKLVGDLKAAGYQVEIRALAVPKAVSELSVASRLEKAIADPTGEMIPRIVEPSIQNEAYEGLPKALDRLEQRGIADRIAVYERGSNTPVYDSRAAANPVPSASESLTDIRDRPMTTGQKTEIAAGWKKVHDAAVNRGASSETLKSYRVQLDAAEARLKGEPAIAADRASPSSSTTAAQVAPVIPEAHSPSSPGSSSQISSSPLAVPPISNSQTLGVPASAPAGTTPPVVGNQPPPPSIHETTATPVEKISTPENLSSSRFSAATKVGSALGATGVAIGVTDKLVHGDTKGAVVEGGTAVVVGTAFAVASRIGPVGEVVAAGSAVKDTIDAAEAGRTGLAVASGAEATLYSVAGTAGAAAAFDFWNPVGWGAGAVALVAGGAAVTITAGKAIYTNRDRIAGWFGSASSHAEAAADSQKAHVSSRDAAVPQADLPSSSRPYRGALRQETASVAPAPSQQVVPTTSNNAAIPTKVRSPLQVNATAAAM